MVWIIESCVISIPALGNGGASETPPGILFLFNAHNYLPGGARSFSSARFNNFPNAVKIEMKKARKREMCTYHFPSSVTCLLQAHQN